MLPPSGPKEKSERELGRTPWQVAQTALHSNPRQGGRAFLVLRGPPFPALVCSLTAAPIKLIRRHFYQIDFVCRAVAVGVLQLNGAETPSAPPTPPHIQGCVWQRDICRDLTGTGQKLLMGMWEEPFAVPHHRSKPQLLLGGNPNFFPALVLRLDPSCPLPPRYSTEGSLQPCMASSLFLVASLQVDCCASNLQIKSSCPGALHR